MRERRRGTLLRFATIGGLALLGGCGAFRASAGPCLGLGASVHAGPADVGFGGGVSVEWGNAYGAIGSSVTAELGLGLARGEFLADGSARRSSSGKAPIRIRVEGLGADLFYPFLGAEPAAYVLNRPSEIAVSVYAVFFSFHLGLDFLGLAREVKELFGAAAGWDQPEPPEGSLAVPPGPDDAMTEPPYTIATRDDVAALASGSVAEREFAHRKVSALLDDPLALYQGRLDTIERDVPIATGLFGADLPEEALASLVAPREASAADAFARALETNDPTAIQAALAVHPWATGATHAARVRIELLVERGELEEARAQLDDLTARAPELDDDEVRAARALAVPIDSLLASVPPTDPTGEANEGSAEVDGYRIGSAGRSVWAATPGGDVAWERSDAIPLGFCARKVVGAASGLAIVEAVSSGRPWVLGIDSDGVVRWRDPLPAPAPGCGAMDQVYALGPGRVYVVRTDRALALDAGSGRLLWMHARHDPEPLAHKLWKDAIPMDFRPPEGPPRRRPDGARGFRVRLTRAVLEYTSGPGRRLERLDARTGELLSGE